MTPETELALEKLQKFSSEAIKETGLIFPSMFFLDHANRMGEAKIDHLMGMAEEYLYAALIALRMNVKSVFLILEVSFLRDGAKDIDCIISDHPESQRAVLIAVYEGREIKIWNAIIDSIGSQSMLGRWSAVTPIKGLIFQNPSFWTGT